MEREKFEESWKSAFDKAEVNPSDKVWTNVELNLEREKGGELKRRLMFYQMLAAASVVLALTIGGIGYYYSSHMTQPAGNTLALQPQPSENAPSSEDSSAVPETAPADNDVDAQSKKEPAHSEDDTPDRSSKSNPTLTTDDDGKNESRLPSTTLHLQHTTDGDGTRFDRTNRREKQMAVVAGDSRAEYPEISTDMEDRPLPPLYEPRNIELNIRNERETVDPVVAMLAKLEQREKEVQGEVKKKKDADDQGENLWTSIGFAAGSFNTMQSSVSASPPPTTSTPRALTAPILDQETKASGYSYSMGVNVGTKLSERWVLQGGLNYLTHLSEYTANNVVISSNNYQQQRYRAVSTNELIHANERDLSNKIVYTAPYNVNNSMRYLSIPMQAGYMVINETFGLQVNAGVATDLFLKNTIEADSHQLDKTSQPGGADSPYRSVNLSGLFGTEFSYRFGDRYRISLNPGLRYPFNTIYKSELGVQSAPLTFDVGLRFRYIFH